MVGNYRGIAVMLGILASTVIATGVATAKPEDNTTSGETVSESQYAEKSNVAGDREEPVAKDRKERSTGGDGGSESSSGNEANTLRDKSSDKESRAESKGQYQQKARQRASQWSSIQQDYTKQRTQRQNVSRESGKPSRASAASGGAKSRAKVSTKTVQSSVIKRQVQELRKEDRAGKIGPAVTVNVPRGSKAERIRSRELRIARKDIYAKPVNEVDLERYKKLYEDAAEEYGFGEDWYILAAVGKVESEHGQNLGPSSAGALGPMQFMPSTWASYGLDANGDGRANIMDPEDAIPAAARYLKAGGAPDDWYEALYTYNHAGWYVEKVLRMAERYRLAAEDEEVGPYYLEDR